MRKTMKKSRQICETQMRLGKEVLQAKTLAEAKRLLRKIPHTHPGDYEQGIKWWHHAQKYPDFMNGGFNIVADNILPGCLEKYSYMNRKTRRRHKRITLTSSR